MNNSAAAARAGAASAARSFTQINFSVKNPPKKCLDNERELLAELNCVLTVVQCFSRTPPGAVIYLYPRDLLRFWLFYPAAPSGCQRYSCPAPQLWLRLRILYRDQCVLVCVNIYVCVCMCENWCQTVVSIGSNVFSRLRFILFSV